jgi:hypothetical protein
MLLRNLVEVLIDRYGNKIELWHVGRGGKDDGYYGGYCLRYVGPGRWWVKRGSDQSIYWNTAASARRRVKSN